MPVYIATDEAGYGPKLGPLVVAASAWIVEPGRDPDAKTSPEVEPACKDPVQNLFETALASRKLDDGSPIVMGDSKKLFRRAGDNPLALLEGPIIAWLNELWPHGVPGTLGGLIEKLAQADCLALAAKPWFAHLDSPVPLAGFASGGTNLAHSPEIDAKTRSIGKRLEPGGRVRLAGLLVRIIDAKEFNRLSSDCGNKATLLSEATVCLVRDLLTSLAKSLPPDDTPTYVFSDRHGGRQRYAGLLQQFFPNGFSSVIAEHKHCSRYQIQDQDRTIDWRFSVKGDSFGPVAFSSMVAKYLRERMMQHFNAYWITNHGKNLKPTAGYPVDANRFCEQIAATARRLGIESEQFIRQR